MSPKKKRATRARLLFLIYLSARQRAQRDELLCSCRVDAYSAIKVLLGKASSYRDSNSLNNFTRVISDHVGPYDYIGSIVHDWGTVSAK